MFGFHQNGQHGSKTNHDVTFIEGIETVAERYDYFILDIFGVIHDGIDPFPGTADCLRALKKSGKTVCLLSNSPRRSSGAARQMDFMGLGDDLYDHIITSGEATYSHFQNPDNVPGRKYWFIGEGDDYDVLNGNYQRVSNVEECDFILNSIPGTSRRERTALLHSLSLASEKRIPMICANPDLVVNIAEEQYECAGTFAKIYEEDMGGNVIYFGKPHRPVYELCYDFFGQPDKSRILAVGDSLHTDVTGAAQFGIDSCFNLVGIHWDEVMMDHAPTLADHDKISKLIEQRPHKPTYAMNGFCW